MIGLFTFFYATVHLSMYVGVDDLFDVGGMAHDIVKHPYVTVGMGVWGLLLPLALTSTTPWVRRLGGHRWQRPHRAVYLAAAGATLHYSWAVKNVTGPAVTYALIFASLLAAPLLMRRRSRATPVEA